MSFLDASRKCILCNVKSAIDDRWTCDRIRCQREYSSICESFKEVYTAIQAREKEGGFKVEELSKQVANQITMAIVEGVDL
jgi:uncharacterized protein YlaI